MNGQRCCGIMGWLFGHKFRSLLTSVEPYDPSAIRVEIESWAMVQILDRLSTKHHRVLCVRCGREPMEDFLK
jgi:hypothetical protein